METLNIYQHQQQAAMTNEIILRQDFTMETKFISTTTSANGHISIEMIIRG